VTPFGAVIRDGRLYGRGAADMKAGLVAALHAIGAAQSPSAVLQVVAGEEDGGVGAFAALRRDADFAACVIPEPTDAAIVCATAGALTWTMRITGRAAHASRRRDGVSALDRYIPVHAALATFEDRLNATIDHPLMRRLELPYPLSVGRLSTGDWSSTVPDELVCEGRLGVPIGSDPAVLRAEFEAIVQAAADAAGPPPEVCWTGGQFAPAETSTDHPLVGVLQDAVTSVTGHPAPLTGVPYGTDMRQYVERGIPTVLYGPGSIDEAHATDESVPLTEVVTATRVLTRLVDTFGQLPTTSR
jgi:acetylornithine deacetylase